MTVKTALTAVAVSFFLLLGCSSLRGGSDEVVTTRNQAAEFIRYGTTYAVRAEYEQALSLYENALGLSISVDDQNGVARALNAIGKIYVATGDLSTAEAQFQRAVKIAERGTAGTTVDTADRMIETLIEGKSNLGDLALRRGDTERALAFFSEAIELVGPRHTTPVAAILYHNVGAAHGRLGRYDDAEEYLRRALAINEQRRIHGEVAANLYMLASVYSRRGLFDEAYDLAYQALERDKMIENPLGIAQDLFALGSIERRRTRFDAAHEYYTRAFDIYLTLGVVPEVVRALSALEENAVSMGREEDARVYATRRETVELRMSPSTGSQR